MRFDKDEFHEVAAVVVKHNAYLKDMSAGQLAQRMLDVAYTMYEPGYVATAGYMLTVYNHPEGGLAVKPSISHIIF
jgi:hypothetical protein